MNDAQAARELVAAAKEINSAVVDVNGRKYFRPPQAMVLDVAKYMEWALEDMEPINLVAHSVRSRIKSASDATVDPKQLQKLKKLGREVDRFMGAASQLHRAIKGMK